MFHNINLQYFVGYICDHSYTGTLSPDKLKGKDLAFFNLFSPHFPGCRVAHIEIRLTGATEGDGDYPTHTQPDSFLFTVVDVDEIATKTGHDAGVERSDFMGHCWGIY